MASNLKPLIRHPPVITAAAPLKAGPYFPEEDGCHS